MSVQTTYNFSTTIGEAGGIIDLAPYAIDSFTNENESGMAFGIGVITGEKPGKTPQVEETAWSVLRTLWLELTAYGKGDTYKERKP